MVLVVLSHGGMLLATNQITPLQRSLGNLSVLFGQVVRGMTAGSRVFEVSL